MGARRCRGQLARKKCCDRLSNVELDGGRVRRDTDLGDLRVVVATVPQLAALSQLKAAPARGARTEACP
jgi:hypothetical protein